jgi:hypothetical protein
LASVGSSISSFDGVGGVSFRKFSVSQCVPHGSLAIKVTFRTFRAGTSYIRFIGFVKAACTAARA